MNTTFTLRRSLTVLTLALSVAWAAPLFAADKGTEAGDPEALTSLKSARKDSLELPGVTACHTCEWRPLKTEMETDQCTGKIGWFDCGRDIDCEKKCVFVKCSSE
jgi:hypothetical protein